ncbi:MAG: TadE family protein [Maricaulaceae bacterium]
MTYLKTILQSYRSQKDGTASIEFVLVAPIMIFLYIGLYELSAAYSVNGAINRSTEISASFPTFETEVDEQILANVMTASTAVIDYNSFNPDNLAIEIYSIEQVSATPTSRRIVGQASYTGNNAAGILPTLTASDFTNSLSSITPGKGFIVGQVGYLYEPSITNKFVKALTLSDSKIFNPRENEGAALIFTTLAGQERAKLNCSLSQDDATFTCNYASQFPLNQGQSAN